MAKGSFMKGFIIGAVIYIIYIVLVAQVICNDKIDNSCAFDGIFKTIIRLPASLFVDYNEFTGYMSVLPWNILIWGLVGGIFLRGK